MFIPPSHGGVFGCNPNSSENSTITLFSIVGILGPRTTLELPVSLSGGGVDISWNYTNRKSLYYTVALLTLLSLYTERKKSADWTYCQLTTWSYQTHEEVIYHCAQENYSIE